MSIQIGFSLLKQGFTSPIIAYEHSVKLDTLVCAYFISIILCYYLIHIADGFHYGFTFLKGNYGALMLVGFYQLVGTYTDNQMLALLLGTTQNIQMPDMKHIEHTGGIAHLVFFIHCSNNDIYRNSVGFYYWISACIVKSMNLDGRDIQFFKVVIHATKHSAQLPVCAKLHQTYCRARMYNLI